MFKLELIQNKKEFEDKQPAEKQPSEKNTSALALGSIPAARSRSHSATLLADACIYWEGETISWENEVHSSQRTQT